MSNVQFKTSLTDEFKVSPEAVEQRIAITEKEDDINGVRVWVSGGGCGGMTSGMT